MIFTEKVIFSFFMLVYVWRSWLPSHMKMLRFESTCCRYQSQPAFMRERAHIWCVNMSGNVRAGLIFILI